MKTKETTNKAGSRPLKRLVRLFCWLRGHDMLNEYHMSNTENGGSSDWGRHRCLRCGRIEDWQYDR